MTGAAGSKHLTPLSFKGCFVVRFGQSHQCLSLSLQVSEGGPYIRQSAFIIIFRPLHGIDTGMSLLISQRKESRQRRNTAGVGRNAFLIATLDFPGEIHHICPKHFHGEFTGCHDLRG